MSTLNIPSGVFTKRCLLASCPHSFQIQMKNLIASLATATISIMGMVALPSTAQEAGSHVKMSTWNNFTTDGYVNGHGGAFSRQTGGVHFDFGGNSTAGYDHGSNLGAHGGYGSKGDYGFQRGAGVTGTGSFGLNETNHFGAEGSSWTQLQW